MTDVAEKRGVKPPEGPARDAKGRLLPGHSGNPGGFPKEIADVQKMLRERCLPRAQERLSELLESEDEQIAVAAVKVTFDYTVPKPKQSLEVGGKLDTGGSVIAGVSSEDLLTAIQALKAKK